MNDVSIEIKRPYHCHNIKLFNVECLGVIPHEPATDDCAETLEEIEFDFERATIDIISNTTGLVKAVKELRKNPFFDKYIDQIQPQLEENYKS